MPNAPTLKPVVRLPAGNVVTAHYAQGRVNANERYNDEVRKYNGLVWEMPMTRRNVFKIPVNSWTGRPPVGGLPRKMSVVRQTQPAQWLTWAPVLNLAIQATDSQQAMIDRYLLWLGVSPGANQVNRA
jgi:hypothetical protein